MGLNKLQHCNLLCSTRYLSIKMISLKIFFSNRLPHLSLNFSYDCRFSNGSSRWVVQTFRSSIQQTYKLSVAVRRELISQKFIFQNKIFNHILFHNSPDYTASLFGLSVIKLDAFGNSVAQINKIKGYTV